MSQNHKYKLVFVGHEAVGKTSIITRYVNDEFDDSYGATIGVDFLTKYAWKDYGILLDRKDLDH